MHDLARLVGNGISSLVSSALDALAAALGGVVSALDAVVPYGALGAVVFVGLLGTAWVLTRR